MANYELGRIGLNLRGSYDAAMTYQRLDTVTYNGSSYVALENCSGILPSDTERWMMLAQGAQGLGVQAGDVITLPMNMPVGAGYISGAGCNIHFTIPLGTELSNVSMVSLSGTIATIQDIADNNFSLSIPLYVKPEVNEADVDNRTVQEHYDSWLAASEMMKLSYEKLNALLGKEADVNE